MIPATVQLSKSEDGVWIQVKAPNGAVGVFNVAAINSPLVRHAFLGWAEACFNQPTPTIKDQVHAIADQIWQGLLDQSQATEALYKIAGIQTSSEAGTG